MICSVRSMCINGICGNLVQVECYISNGLPAFDIVGLPDMVVKVAQIFGRVQKGIDYVKATVA